MSLSNTVSKIPCSSVFVFVEEICPVNCLFYCQIGTTIAYLRTPLNSLTERKNNMKKDHLDRLQEYEPPMETIAGMSVSPKTDIPFGKQFQMGFYEYTIYESAVEQGYQAGIARHQDLARDLNEGAPVMLDDTQFAAILDAFMPNEMSSRDNALWRAHFIAGWCSVFLGLVRDDEVPIDV